MSGSSSDNTVGPAGPSDPAGSSSSSSSSSSVDNAGSARKILRRALKGSLGTLDGNSGLPHVSLVLCATDPTGAPLLLLSQLARHTQNIIKNEHACLMLDDTGGLVEPLTGGRLSLSGTVEGCQDETCRQRYLARHASSALYANFSDFSFYRLNITHAHYVGGFGAIHDFKREELVLDISKASALIGQEAEIIDHMNEDHGDVVELIATTLHGETGGEDGWRLTGIDPWGCDLMMGFKAVRHEFLKPIATADDARHKFIELKRHHFK